MLFLSLIVASFPWETIRGYEFVDLQRNIERFHFYYYNFESVLNGISILNFNDEPLWKYINLFGSRFFLGNEIFFNILSFFIFIVFSFFIYNRTKSYFYCLLLINPITLDFVLSQQRSSFALAIIFLCFDANITKKLFVYVAAILTHTISAVVIFIQDVAVKLFSLKSERFSLVFFMLIISFFISYATVYGREFILGALGDRRAFEYDAGSNSLIYALPWLMYGFILLFFNRSVNNFTLISSVYMFVFFGVVFLIFMEVVIWQ